MGQYFKLVNLDRKEYIHPHRLDDGAKLLEIAFSVGGVATAMVMLCSSGGEGNNNTNQVYGRWAGDRVVLAGDYAEPGLFGIDSTENLYCVAGGVGWREISDLVKPHMED